MPLCVRFFIGLLNSIILSLLVRESENAASGWRAHARAVASIFVHTASRQPSSTSFTAATTSCSYGDVAQPSLALPSVAQPSVAQPSAAQTALGRTALRRIALGRIALVRSSRLALHTWITVLSIKLLRVHEARVAPSCIGTLSLR